MIDSRNLRTVSWTFLAVFIFFMVFGPSNLEYFWSAFLFLSFLALTWTIYLIYICEKITIYLTSILVAAVGAFSLLACSAAYFAGARFWGDASIYAFCIGVTPAAITLSVYFFLVTGKPTFHPFEYDGIKVQPRPQNKQSKSASYNPVLVAGLATLGASLFTKTVGALTAGMVGMFGTMTCSILLLFYSRHIIRGLRTLRIQQKTMPAPYTFMQIDEIREARSRWWLSRLFKWVASWRKAPGA